MFTGGIVFQGRNCENDLNMCRSNPCLNGGACTNSPGTFVCTCTSGFTGPICNDTNMEEEPMQTTSTDTTEESTQSTDIKEQSMQSTDTKEESTQS